MTSVSRAASTTSGVIVCRRLILQDALDLGEEACEEAEFAVGGPRDRGDRFGVGEVVDRQVQVEALPVVGEDEAQLVGAQRLSGARSRCGCRAGVAREALFEAGHADEDQPDRATVIEVA
jgi:hypothetical protein